MAHCVWKVPLGSGNHVVGELFIRFMGNGPRKTEKLVISELFTPSYLSSLKLLT